ncbi:helix-turn-helix domain-containing protein [Paenibacillus spongiae]|uniref:helix-turn-helix domain-containing protein n=1 Tax=Paenibacillus spongiae TaxID=2909671 RepID=UPI00283AB5D2|nr:helix-turn-helix domain-containing protein [Paenibacillus spongiae]
MTKLSNNELVSMEVLVKICRSLACDIGTKGYDHNFDKYTMGMAATLQLDLWLIILCTLFHFSYFALFEVTAQKICNTLNKIRLFHEIHHISASSAFKKFCYRPIFRREISILLPFFT